MTLPASAREIWSAAQAQAWYGRQPWMVGANYIPASAVNQLEMWQAATFDPERIDRELGWAQGIGMNTLRVFLHDLLWREDPEGFKQRIRRFLEISSRHHMRVLFVLLDSVWEPEPKLGPQNPPIPGVHNSRWVQSPGLSVLRDPAQESRLEAYVKGMVGAFAQDPRVIGWDVWNEPASSKSGRDLERVVALLPKVFAWARSVNPEQPLTSGVYEDGGWTEGKPTPTEAIQLEQSDVLSFHDYHWPEVFAAKATRLLTLGRPVWCTEYLARGAGSTFDGSLPIGKRLNIAMINWGLVDGKTQTRFPWDSWSFPYVNGREPAVWHHDVFRTDGTPYRQAEVDLIRALANAPKGVVPAWAPIRLPAGSSYAD
jgi:Cellulase (glycosyl hydrolase family 5)